MIWFIFSILTAFFESMKDVSSKKSLKNTDDYIVSWSYSFFSLPFLIPILFFMEIPSLNSQFWIILIITGSLGSISTIIYMKAIKSSDLSITTPMLTFVPLFLLITSPLMLGEFPNLIGLIGIFLIFAGSYLLNIKEINLGYLSPLRKLLKEKGPRLMLIVAFLWSISSNLHKMGIQESSPTFWVISTEIFLTIVLTPIMLYKSQKNLDEIKTGWKALVPIGLFSALTLIFQMNAFKLALVVYVISVKRISAILDVLLGHFIFKEKNVYERLIGAVIMVIGVLFIGLS
jgi:uncharacterized membrane protein